MIEKERERRAEYRRYPWRIVLAGTNSNVQSLIGGDAAVRFTPHKVLGWN